MQVQPFTVGPILGYVEPTRARIFGRARPEWQDQADKEQGLRRCFGAVRAKSASDTDFGPPRIFKMLPHFDLTGIGIVNGLEPETACEYQAGWFYSEGEPPDPLGGEPLEWDGVPARPFRTAATADDQQRSYVFGSCRYLLRLFGGWVFEGRGDKTFRSVLEQMAGGTRTDGLLMLGDQIYADDLNFLGPDSQVDEFLRRYRMAFTREHLRTLMAIVPTYMTLDDHEIEDDWPRGADPRDEVIKYPAAMHAYSIYQMSHSPLANLNDAGTALAGVPNHFWYTFADGCCDFFVMDARTERRDGIEIVNQAQMRELKSWLEAGKRKKRVKVIVSSVPIFPDFLEPSHDKWSGFQAQRDELLNFIHDRKIRRVVTLSGDVHSSMAVELLSDTDPDFRILSVVSSPFYWPYPHTSRRQFQLEGRLASQSPYMFRLENASEVHTTDNFTRLTIAPEGVEVKVHERKGEQLGKTRTYLF